MTAHTAEIWHILSWTLSASAVNPIEAKIGAIVTRYDNKTGVVIRKNVICFPCLKEMQDKNNSNNEDVCVCYLGADDPKEEIRETLDQWKRELGIPRDQWWLVSNQIQCARTYILESRSRGARIKGIMATTTMNRKYQQDSDSNRDNKMKKNARTNARLKHNIENFPMP